METRANYALIGLFTLAVIAASFLFVYWVSSPGRSGSQQTYKIIFTGSINGLSRGGWVMFNGVRVGEVKDINLVPQDPQHVYAIINIDSRVPIRADTKAHLESTGFTGVSTVALVGGAPMPRRCRKIPTADLPSSMRSVPTSRTFSKAPAGSRDRPPISSTRAISS